MYIKVSSLPSCLQSVLSKMQYNKKDISVNAKTSTDLCCAGGDGQRGYAAIVNLSTGESRIKQGSWGGSNMFTPSNPVDNDKNVYDIPENGAVILGETGYRNLASIYVHPASLAPLLPPVVDVSSQEKDCLTAYKTLKSSYRPDYPSSLIDSLVSKGLLKRNKNGATQITTEGKNAVPSKWD